MAKVTRRPHARLQDIVENIDGLLDATAGLQIETILDSYILRRTTERALQIIAQAATALPVDLIETEPHIPWKGISSLGNHLSHAHSRLDPRVLSNVLNHELPTLRPAVLRLMELAKDSSPF